MTEALRVNGLSREGMAAYYTKWKDQMSFEVHDGAIWMVQNSPVSDTNPIEVWSRPIGMLVGSGLYSPPKDRQG